MPAVYPGRFNCHNYHTPEAQSQQPWASAGGETCKFHENWPIRDEITRAPKQAAMQNLHTARRPYVSLLRLTRPSPQPLQFALQSMAVLDQSSVAFSLPSIVSFSPTAVSNRRGYKFSRHHRLLSPHPHPFQLRLTCRPHPPRKSPRHSRRGAPRHRRDLQSQPASYAPPVELHFASVLSRFFRGFVIVRNRAGMHGFIPPSPLQNADLLSHDLDLSRQCGERGRKALDPYLTQK